MLDTDLPVLGRDHSNDDGHNLIVLLAQQGRGREVGAAPLWDSLGEGQQRDESTLMYFH